jgi:ABC-type Fe3+/spermidine/putrescine transport system ATPase subunit
MAFGLKMRGTARAEIDRRVADAAAALSIEHLLARRPRELSGGQRQRVAVGRAIVREPEVFLFDEPLSNLDAKLRVQMRAELARLHRRLGTTVIYVTHDQVEAMTLGDRIVLMNHGVIQQIDAPLAIYRRPANRVASRPTHRAGVPDMTATHPLDPLTPDEIRQAAALVRAAHDRVAQPHADLDGRPLADHEGHAQEVMVRQADAQARVGEGGVVAELAQPDQLLAAHRAARLMSPHPPGELLLAPVAAEPSRVCCAA